MDSNKTNNPFDIFFKLNFSKKEVIQSFIQEYLPSKLRDGLDLDSIEITKDSFVDEEFSEHFSDILCKVKKKDEDSFLYFLLDHKSYNDQWVWFQILRYMVNIWSLYLKQNKNAKSLPAIVPVIISHGKGVCYKGQSLFSLFKLPEETKEYIPNFRCEIFDLTSIPDDAIRGELILKIQFLLLKYGHNPQLYEKLPAFLKMVDEQRLSSDSAEFLESVLHCLGSVVDMSRADEVAKEVRQSLKGGDIIMATMADKWFQEGIQQGIERGIEQGREQQKIDTARKLILAGMSNENVKNILELEISKIEEVRNTINSNKDE